MIKQGYEHKYEAKPGWANDMDNQQYLVWVLCDTCGVHNIYAQYM